MKYILSSVIYFFTFQLYGQGPNLQWAGPDTVTCGEKGVTLGLMNACNDCCYKWTPNTNLSCDDCPNPVAKPEHEIRYKVTVVANNLAWVETDEVNVGLSFGEIRFNPDHLNQGSDDEVIATLNHINTNNVQWGFGSSSLGCTILGNGTSATLTPGTTYGTITVTAENLDIAGCITREEIDINEGTKDVYAIDVAHPNRMAKTGETLYMLSDTRVLIKAIPNEGGFQDGAPYWEFDAYDSQILPDGVAEQIVDEPSTLIGKISEHIAGEPPGHMPKVRIIRKTPVTTEYGNTINTALQSLSSTITSYMKFANAEPSSYNPCGSSTPFEADFVLNYLNFNETEVEKYASPDIGKKYTLSTSGNINITGNLNHPVYTRTIVIPPPFNVTVCTKLGITASASLGLTLAAVKDQSVQDTTWNFDNPTITLSLCVGGGITGFVSAGNYQLEASANFSMCVKPTIYFDLPSSSLLHKGVVEPATVNIVAKVVDISDMANTQDVFSLPSPVVQLIAPFETSPSLIYQF